MQLCSTLELLGSVESMLFVDGHKHVKSTKNTSLATLLCAEFQTCLIGLGILLCEL